MADTRTASVSTPAADQPDGETPYVVRWNESQKLFCVWNTVRGTWASCPGFSDERIARVVADSRAAPQPRVTR